MNGAITLPSEKMISAPMSSIMSTRGASQYFFLTFKNCQNSAAIESLPIAVVLSLLMLKVTYSLLFVSSQVNLLLDYCVEGGIK